MITLMHSNYAPSAGHLERLAVLVGAGRVGVASSEAAALALAPGTQFVLGHRYLRQILPHAAQLRWVQSSAAGVDALPLLELGARGVLLSRNPVNSRAIAQHALALAWALMRRLPELMAAQKAGVWAPPPSMLPLPRKALMLGLGGIGMELARLLRALGIYVRASALSGSVAQRDACDEFLPTDDWRAALPDTDLLLLAMPLSSRTRGAVGAREIAALPAHAVLVNVARGALVDTTALCAALYAGQLGGAALDVLESIPAAGDPLWRVPNLLITPKVAAYHPGMRDEFERFCEMQVARYLAGQPPEALVDVEAAG